MGRREPNTRATVREHAHHAEPPNVIKILGADPLPERPGRSGGWSEVPWRSIIGAVGVVTATAATILVLSMTFRVVVWVAVQNKVIAY